MKKELKDIPLKMISNTQKIYITLTMIYPFCLKECKFEKFNNLHDKGDYLIHIRKLKQALLNLGLILKKVHRVIKFNQKAWLKPYIDMI